MLTRKKNQFDRRRNQERRAHHERRYSYKKRLSLRLPGWGEQCVQFLTRYLFCWLGIAFFNHSSIQAAWLSTSQLNVIFTLYFLINTVGFAHAWRVHYSPLRYRLTMWVDIAMVTIAVLNDPYVIPPSLLAFIMVVLGNGMRYGMRLFSEALIGSFGGAMIALGLRYVGMDSMLMPGFVFLNLFGGIILIYAYILMNRIEKSRTELERNSMTDILTGLMNRRGLFDAAELMFNRLKQENGRLVVMFADLDKFKLINDTHGHAVGDRTLRDLAAILRHSIRGSDIVSRYGGDEFVLVLPDIDLHRAERVARRIQNKVSNWSKQNRLDCSITIGMGEAPEHGNSLTTLLDCVDKVLCQSKSLSLRGGINTVEAMLSQQNPVTMA